ncbi:MAG: glycoside hydrolase family 97 protein, partial [Muribaculaceae bacterium]|nr:glycoside hydrolase family 97 protein [Muribaculaceae bacterium]
FNGEPALWVSPMVIFIDGVTPVAGVKLKASAPGKGSVSYTNTRGKSLKVDKMYNSRTFSVPEQGYEIELRVFDDGLAYRYRLLPTAGGDEGRCRRIIAENSGFAFPDGSRGWLTQLAKAKEGWCATNPSYEDHYHMDVALEEKSDERQGWIFPALVRSGNVWTLLTESGYPGEYPGCHLSEARSNTFMVEFPHADHNLRHQPVWASVADGGVTPWRVAVIGDSPAAIVETTLPDDLAERTFSDDGGLKPGKASWSWLYHADAWTTYEGQRKFIDLAARLGLEYCLTDALWDVNIGRERMGELASYARERGVGLLVWYNSNGAWNDAPQSPTDCFNTREARCREMEWLKSIGIAGVKIDFFGGDKQDGMQLYEDILCDADSFGLVVNFHGATLPRGWSRIHRSYMNSEAVFGQEMCRGAGPNEAARPAHCTVLPFARNAVGPMDFTPVVLNRRLAWVEGDDDADLSAVSGEVFRDAGNAAVRVTTDAFELALPVIFFEPLTHFGITVSDVDRFPETVWKYVGEVPTVWDRTVFLAGEPGKYVVMAREKDGECYVAAINGTDSEISVPLKGWGPKTRAEYVIRSSDNGELVCETGCVMPDKTEIRVLPRDGFVMKLTGRSPVPVR